MHQSVLDFTKRTLQFLKPTNRTTVLEVGSFNVNGSIRPLFVDAGIKNYTATDMRAGPGVDLVVDCVNLRNSWFEQSFDIVASTEMLEHVEDWSTAITQMKSVLKLGGYLLLTTRSKGFPLHDFPGDYWRFELSDMQTIFADMQVHMLETDPQAPGVFVLAQKINTKQMSKKDLMSIPIWSMK